MQNLLSPSGSSLNIIALNGDCWSTPASTLESLWSALGAGAGVIALAVHLTKDRQLLCAPEPILRNRGGNDVNISTLDLHEAQQHDAGASFRSTQLDAAGQPTGVRGFDNPWKGLKQEDVQWPLKRRVALYHPSLNQVLQVFGRRAHLWVKISDTDVSRQTDLLDTLLGTLSDYGLNQSIEIVCDLHQLEALKTYATPSNCILDVSTESLTIETIRAAEVMGCRHILAAHEQFLSMSHEQLLEIADFANSASIEWTIHCRSLPFAPTRSVVEQIVNLPCLTKGILTPGVLPTSSKTNPKSVVFVDNFPGNELDERQWRAGYSHINRETKLSVGDELIIRIDEGTGYSGAAAVTSVPVHGVFDACVDFMVEHPYQATTFELAAIGIDPGYDHYKTNKDLNTKNVNLTFDVHGSPPYASSERDQNDAFRCGWNNSFNLTQVKCDFKAASVNMYNKYGRGVGDGGDANKTGSLRLLRQGSIFNAYYRDKYNAEWVCSGSMLVPNLPEDIYIRLAAKHWAKLKDEDSPWNVIHFTNFSIRQP